MRISLRLPLDGTFPITFTFGATPDSELIKQKFTLWGIVGHNGLDYSMPEGTPILAAAPGKVVKSGVNGDFGISVTVQHPWGESIYAHLTETKVAIGDKVKRGQLLGLSGKTGAAFGAHLHFGIKPTNPDPFNGYHGYIDPSPYFKKTRHHEPN